MATSRYVCRKCNDVFEFDSRRKKIVCPICGKDLSIDWFYGGVVGHQFYGTVEVREKTYTIPEGVEYLHAESGYCVGRSYDMIGFGRGVFGYNQTLETVVLPTTLKTVGGLGIV